MMCFPLLVLEEEMDEEEQTLDASIFDGLTWEVECTDKVCFCYPQSQVIDISFAPTQEIHQAIHSTVPHKQVDIKRPFCDSLVNIMYPDMMHHQ